MAWAGRPLFIMALPAGVRIRLLMMMSITRKATKLMAARCFWNRWPTAMAA